jgi:hypothetical protein
MGGGCTHDVNPAMAHTSYGAHGRNGTTDAFRRTSLSSAGIHVPRLTSSRRVDAYRSARSTGASSRGSACV